MTAYDAVAGTFWVYPLRYQSGSITFTEWISLFTLALAPLIAHIAAGCPAPSYLTPTPPKWHERIALFNPTSILWRYAMIADRRIPARAWDAMDMAAANALFWTARRGWDGSEEMVARAAPHCVRLPERARIALLSAEFFKTVVVTLQGTQALAALGLALTGSRSASDGFVTYMGVDLIFFPLAFIGLVRLLCAFWLTDEFTYSMARRGAGSELVGGAASDDAGEGGVRISLDSLLDNESSRPNLKEDRFLPASYWGSRVFRVVSLLPTLLLVTICLLFLIQPGGGKQFTLTAFLVALFYLIFLFATLVICGYYLARGETSTTIPCLTSKWYEIYTGVLIVMAVIVFAFSCIETRPTACGRWTSAPFDAGDFNACADLRTPNVIEMDFHTLPEFGLATSSPRSDIENKTLADDEFWVRNFTGTCLGAFGSTLVKHVSTLEVVDLDDLAVATRVDFTE
ncbi:hypothetical protein M426DRAFT_15021 [Hypoxylon sp. CI-4A]|nr:hypothetical protein M426DRAFT_15021 [Hypoxylon sp. CI-4A]